MPRPGGSTARWRVTRDAVFARDGWRCRGADVRAGLYLPHLRPWAGTIIVSPTCTGGDRAHLHAHHVRGRRATGDDPRFLLTLCAACNMATGDPTRRDTAPTPVVRW